MIGKIPLILAVMAVRCLRSCRPASLSAQRVARRVHRPPRCLGNSPTACTGTWGWYQGGTLLPSGSISGTSRGTIVQPAAADTVVIGLTQPAGQERCGVSQPESFSPGSHINFTVRLHEAADAYHSGCFDTFSMKS